MKVSYGHHHRMQHGVGGEILNLVPEERKGLLLLAISMNILAFTTSDKIEFWEAEEDKVKHIA